MCGKLRKHSGSSRLSAIDVNSCSVAFALSSRMRLTLSGLLISLRSLESMIDDGNGIGIVFKSCLPAVMM